MRIFLFLSLLTLFALFACNAPKEKKRAIGILTPATHPSLKAIEKGFVDYMEQQNPGKYRFVTYNAQGNKTLMRSEIEEMIRQDYDLIFSIATVPSQMTAEVFRTKGISTPIVFTCVSDPLGLHIVPTEESPGGTVTGVKEMLDLEEELATLLQCKPNTQTVLLVYNPTTPGLQQDQRRAGQILRAKNIDLITVETFHSNEIMAKVSPFMDRVDALIVLKDNTVVAGLDVLIKLCDRHHIPLMASDLDSPDRGAAFGYGVHEIDFGVEAAKKALLVLEQGVAPGDIPVTPITDFTLRVNREAAEKQGIPFSYLEAIASEYTS